MAIVQTYLENSIKANVSYGNLNIEMNNNANKYMKELTITDSEGKIKISLTQAKAFAGVTEQRNEQTGEIIKNAQGEIQYRFELNEDNKRFSGHTILASAADYGIGTLSGFDAVILKNNETGEISFNVRGTEAALSFDSVQDLLADYHLAISGFTPQEVSMENFYNKLLEENIISSSEKLDLKENSILTSGFIQNENYLNKKSA